VVANPDGQKVPAREGLCRRPRTGTAASSRELARSRLSVDLVVVVDLVVDFDGDGNGDMAARTMTVRRLQSNRANGAADTSGMLSFQRLDVYQRAIEFLVLVYDIVGELPRGNADRADQLMRSAESVVRNIAEGAGRWSEADSASRYKIARGEAMECAASLDVMRVRKLVSDARYVRGIQLLEGVVAMLTKMF
jgi:four helix bundle protein